MDPRRLLPTLAVLAVVCVLATLALTWVRHAPDTAPDHPVPAHPVQDRSAGQPSSVTPRPSPRDNPSLILAGWDRQRSVAWAKGDVTGLRDLYVADSRAGAADVSLLQRYRDRGLRVTGLRTQVLSLRVIDQSSRRLRLVVTDRIVGGTAVGRGAPVALPADRASTRRIDLVRVGNQWLVEEVRDQASAAASTSLTSSSSKS